MRAANRCVTRCSRTDGLTDELVASATAHPDALKYPHERRALCGESWAGLMAGGYTPVFSTVFTGSLYGRYPDTAAWLFLLALADKHGNVDMTAEFIAGSTGMPLADLKACIERFMQPDPASRSAAHEGRRLIPIEPGRPWGWTIVNHSLYKEKARLMGKAERERESGANAQRMKDRRRPPKTAADPLSYADAYTDSDKKSEVPDTSSGGVGGKASRERSAEQRGSRIPTPFLVTAEMRKWASEKTPHVDLDRTTEQFCDYWRALPGQRGRKLDWELTWKNRMRECEDKAVQRSSNGRSKETIDETLARLRKAAEAEGEPL